MLAKALVDCGSEIGSQPPASSRPGKGFSADTVVIKGQVCEKIEIPPKKWTSRKPVPLLVAPLDHSEIVLGMPFPEQEKILIGLAAHEILAPATSSETVQCSYCKYYGRNSNLKEKRSRLVSAC